jgi:cell division protein FtsQ
MRQRKSKKILAYFFLLLVVGSINNINFNDLKLQNINNINIVGLDIEDKLILLKKIKNFNLDNIFFISKSDLINEIESNSLVEKYFIFKRYPSSIDINIEKTIFLAKINNNGQVFYLGSNGKFTKNDFSNNQLPYIFGSPEVIEFFDIKEVIDKSKITYKEIKNLYFYPSRRWDLELRNNIIIKLPKDNTNLALNLALEFLYKEEFKDVKMIDARIENQIILDDRKNQF